MDLPDEDSQACAADIDVGVEDDIDAAAGDEADDVAVGDEADDASAGDDESDRNSMAVDEPSVHFRICTDSFFSLL